jgi:ferrous iron transport protein B
MVIAGVGGVLVFLPQIVLLFLFIAILEDCGYMARAAFVMDKLMSKIGLSGKSFVPLMSSFACAVPGIMATRTIENRRDRFVTIPPR